MKIAKYAVVFVGLLVLQIVVLPFFSIFDIVPDAILIGILVLALNEGTIMALAAAVTVGLVRDAFTTHFIGAGVLALVIAAFLAGTFFKHREKLSFQTQTIYLFVIIFIHHLTYYGLFLLDKKLSLFELVFRYALPGAVYTLIGMAIAHFLLPRGVWR